MSQQVRPKQFDTDLRIQMTAAINHVGKTFKCMKTIKTSQIFRPTAIRAQLLVVLGAIALAMTPSSRAGLAVPYTVDADTLHLWHLNTTNGMVTPDSQSNNLQTTPMALVVTPGKTNFPFGTPTQFPTPQPGEFPSLGNGIQFSQACCLYGPYNVVTNADGTTNFNGGVDGCITLNTNISDFVNTNTGAFTWEAVICPQFNAANPPFITQLVCGDSGFSSRSWQLRFTGGHLEYIDNISVGSKTYDGNIPTTGPDAAVVGGWYHVALAFTGTAPTNGDAANKLTMYWTRLDPANTNAHPLATFTKTTMQNGLSFFCVSGSGRANIWNNVAGAGGFLGIMQEIRLSGVCRTSNQMAFNSTISSDPPIFVLQPPAATLVGFGKTLTITATAFASPAATFGWTQNGAPLTGQTNNTLVISNVTFAANGTYQCNATNSVGGTNSTTCVVSVGAPFDALFNSGVDNNGNPLNVTAPGSVDLHYFLEQSPDPFSTIPNAIVWGNQGPVSPIGAYAPNGATATWIGPEENNGQGAATAGPYDFQTRFYIDQGDPATATLTGSIIPAYGTGAGATINLLLNGVSNPFTVTGNPLTTPVPFTFTSANGLAAGSNTLDFILTGGGTAAVAIQVQLSGICTNALPAGLPVITNEPPASQTFLYGTTATLPVVALGRPPLSYQWYSNNVAISGATSQNFSFVATNITASQVVGQQVTANYQVVVGNDSGSVTSSVDTVTIQIPPLTIASAGVPIWNSTTNETNVIVIFSKPVDPTTAATTANYSLDNGASVSSATLVTTTEVVLTTSVLNPLTSYNLTVQNVEDFLDIVMNPSPSSVPIGVYPAALALWLRADTGVTTDGNGGVTQWNDLSGNGNNLTQTFGASFEPLLVTNALNGAPVIRFVGSNINYMTVASSASLAITNDISIFAVVNFATLANGTNGMIVSKTTGAQPASYDYYVNASVARLGRGNGATSVFVNASNAPTVGVPHLLDVEMQGTSVTERIDGHVNGSGTLKTTMSDNGDNLYIGSRTDNGNHLTGDLAELIVVGSALSSNDVASLESYIATGYNLTIGPAVNTTPTNIVASLTGGQLTLSWPANHIGWRLQAQTNTAPAGIGTNWVTVPNSSSTNQVVIPVNPTNGSVFFRMIYP